MNHLELKAELLTLTDKWKGKPEPPFMSNEYIDRRFDRLRYAKLRSKLNVINAKGKVKDIVEEAKKVFGNKEESS